ncbi:MAG TPA: hypothetical protein VE604_04015 [Candidatus Polarisedimenticolia bacterium]|nr:hypothetical protein [Candidatus Polarisedimenticolia bacterium]
MHEIDPQSGEPLKDDVLTVALDRLAASSRQGAPPGVGAELATAFRRHHARRRLVRRMSVAALAACITIVAGLLSIRSPRQIPTKAQPHEVAGSAPAQPVNATSPAAVRAKAVHPSVKHAKGKGATTAAASRREFLALPGYDPAVPAEQLSVVRVQLPASALWQMGAPVSPDSGARKFMADFVVAQDGTPYAVRLVQ